LDDAEMHAGAYDFYVITGGTGEMIVGGKIANWQNLMDKDGPVPGEYRGQPIVGGQTFKVRPATASDSPGHAASAKTRRGRV